LPASIREKLTGASGATLPLPMPPVLKQITLAQDGARILFRFFKTSNDSFAMEATVREFSKDGAYVRLARTAYKSDRGGWLRVADLLLVDVLEPKCELKDRPQPEKKPRKGKREKGDEWKDSDQSGELPLDEGDDD
jgi:hypothetical protein